MASYRRAAWYLCWWGCLLGVLQVAHGAERISVPQPSIQDLLNRANPTLVENSLGYVQAYDSAFQYQQRSYSAPIKQSIKVPTPAVKEAVKGALKDGIKGGLKANAAGVAVNVAVAAAVAAAGWVIDEAGQPAKKTDGQPANTDPTKSEYNWYLSGYQDTYSTPALACQAYGNRVKSDATLKSADAQYVSDGEFQCVAVTYYNPSFPTTYRGQVLRSGSKCPATTNYQASTGACLGTGTAPLADADYDTLNGVINAQSAAFRAQLAKEACEGSLSPQRCYQALQDAASFLNSGPSSIQGPKSTTTTTSKNADGSVSTGTTTRDTKFDMKYDGTGATATPSTTTTTTDGKGGESTSTDKEDEDSNSGTAPKDEDKETASPCTTNCDGPAYKDLYTKTDVTKEGVLDTYAAKVKALPIMSAVGNFFTVSGGGSCPVWSGTIDIGWGQSVTLSNDFACQPWFTALSPAFHAVLMLVAAWLAFRVSILD